MPAANQIDNSVFAPSTMVNFLVDLLGGEFTPGKSQVLADLFILSISNQEELAVLDFSSAIACLNLDVTVVGGATQLLQKSYVAMLAAGDFLLAERLLAVLLLIRAEIDVPKLLRPLSKGLQGLNRPFSSLLIDGLRCSADGVKNGGGCDDLSDAWLTAVARLLIGHANALQAQGDIDACLDIWTLLSEASFLACSLNLTRYARQLKQRWLFHAAAAEDDGDFQLAELDLRKCVEFFPDDSICHARLGKVIMKRAEAALVDNLKPECARYLDVLVQEDFWQNESFRRISRIALELKINDLALRLVFSALNRVGLAAVSLRTDVLIAEFSLLANRLREEGDMVPLARLIDRAREVLGTHAAIDYQDGLQKLSSGAIRDGWRLLRARASLLQTPPAVAAIPVWNGQDHVPSLVVWWPAGAGIGGEVMRLVFIPQLLNKTSKLAVVCDERLHPALTRAFPQVACFPQAVLNDKFAASYTHAIDLISLPALFLDEDSEPLGPCLAADPVRVEELRRQLGDTSVVRCGFSWYTTNPRSRQRRSLPAAVAADFLEKFPDVQFVSLQHGTGDAGASALPDTLTLFSPVTPELDVEGLLAAVSLMDLIVTIDNSVAHLAGALGVPTVLLLPANPEIQWSASGTGSLFYRSLYILRQVDRGRWLEPLMAAREVLRGCVAAKRINS